MQTQLWISMQQRCVFFNLQTDFVEGSQRQRESSLGKSRSQREWFHGKKPNNNSDERRLVSNKLPYALLVNQLGAGVWEKT